MGIGVNPGIKRLTGLATIDECKAGMVFVAFGENRFMGGKNESTLNIDLFVPERPFFVIPGIWCGKGGWR